jgi:mannose-6-phosphate isomerase
VAHEYFGHFEREAIFVKGQDHFSKAKAGSPALAKRTEIICMPDQTSTELYPLKLSSLAKEKVWGGTRIAQTFAQDIPADSQIGEVWLVWDQLIVANGPLRGAKLASLVRSHPLAILGKGLAGERPAEFPLLTKFLDAQDALSVQVHPGDEYARRREGEPFGKSEMWYVIGVEPGAQLIHGVQRPITRSQAEQATASGTLQTMLKHVQVAPGDVIYNPPGTIHALGSGILLFELQQSSDLTYRLYDWNRNDPSRQLHVEKALDVADLEPLVHHKTRPIEVQEPGVTRTYLCLCEQFSVERLTVHARVLERPAGACFHLLTALHGEGLVHYGSDAARDIPLSCGESLLLPACLHEYEIITQGGPLVVIKGYVPDLPADVIDPLRARGVPDEEIILLGGDPRRSDLARYVDIG